MTITSPLYVIVSSRVFILLISYLMIIATLHCSICIPIFTFNFNVKVCFYNIKLISQKSNQVMHLARFFLQGIMFIKFISMLPERLKHNCLLSTFCGEICHHNSTNKLCDGKFHHKKWTFHIFLNSLVVD